MYGKIRAKIDPIRPMTEEQAKELKKQKVKWENYKIAATEQTIRTQFVKRNNQGWKLRQDL